MTFVTMQKKVGNYTIDEHIASGTFGKVYIGVHEPTNEKVAIKIIKKKEHKVDVRREYDLMMKIHHPFIVTLYEVIEDPEDLYIIMEYVEGQTLLDYIKGQTKIPDHKIKHIFCELVSALLYLHNALNIVHRDLKLENIMIDKNLNIRLLDFGLSNQLAQNTSMFQTKCGSPSYSAPEMLLGRPYTYKIDMWSLGIILYALAFNSLPFGDDNLQLLTAKIVNRDPFYPAIASTQVITVIKSLLNKDPELRPSASEAATIPWASSYNNSYILEDDFNSTQKWESQQDDVRSKIMKRRQMNLEIASLQKTSGEINSFKIGGFTRSSSGRNQFLSGIRVSKGSTFRQGAKRLIFSSNPSAPSSSRLE